MWTRLKRGSKCGLLSVFKGFPIHLEGRLVLEKLNAAFNIKLLP
jgi:hypothetical protein